MSESIQPLGLEPITQYLSHHNNDYHDMQVANLIGITNACHVDANSVLAEFDRQKTQLAKFADIDVTEFDGFHTLTYAAQDEATVSADFGANQRVVNFFDLLSQARASHLAADASRVAVFAANQQDFTIRLSATDVTVTSASESLTAYVEDVILNGYSA